MDTPVWLTAEQQQVWRAYLNATNRVRQHLDGELRQFDLDLGEYEILVRLSEAPYRSIRMSELADQVGQSRSRLTHTVTRLEAKELLTRGSCPGDRRGVLATLTDQGYSFLEKVAPYHVASVREILVDPVCAEDFAALGRAMQSVLDADLPPA
ncbi:MAG: MarR family transcriptional regulator [Propionibacteriaceae bacterium]|nr:MarR family transcriptional regulator [Propionibacteriaceae bacterium]